MKHLETTACAEACDDEKFYLYSICLITFFHDLSPFELDEDDCCCPLIRTSTLRDSELVSASARSTLCMIVPPLLHPEMPKHELSGQWWEVDLCIYEPIHIQKPSKVRGSKHGHIHIYICEYTQVSFWVLAFSIWSQQNDIPQVHTCIYTCGRFPKQMQVLETHSINMRKVANV